MLLPETLIVSAASGLGAGPPTTEPSLMLNWLPWHGQSIVPSLIWLTRHPMCVQTALNALKSPETGCVTTTFSAVKILPLPTGISLVGARAFAPLPAAGGVEAPGAAREPELVDREWVRQAAVLPWEQVARFRVRVPREPHRRQRLPGRRYHRGQRKAVSTRGWASGLYAA